MQENRLMEYGELCIQDNTKIDFSCINVPNSNVYIVIITF